MGEAASDTTTVLDHRLGWSCRVDAYEPFRCCKDATSTAPANILILINRYSVGDTPRPHALCHGRDGIRPDDANNPGRRGLVSIVPPIVGPGFVRRCITYRAIFSSNFFAGWILTRVCECGRKPLFLRWATTSA